MNKLEKYLYHIGVKKLTFDSLELWYQKKEIDNLLWVLTVDDLLIQEKAFKLLAISPSEQTLLVLCDYASTCSWQLNYIVFTTLLATLEQDVFLEIKNNKSKLIEQMTEMLSSEKVERSKAENEGRELPSDRLKKIQKDHRHFIGKGIKSIKEEIKTVLCFKL